VSRCVVAFLAFPEVQKNLRFWTKILSSVAPLSFRNADDPGHRRLGGGNARARGANFSRRYKNSCLSLVSF
jgi:hypothetical protein